MGPAVRPDTGNAFGLNPVGVLIWKLLDGRHFWKISRRSSGRPLTKSPMKRGEHLNEFIQELVQKGLAGF